MKATAGDRKEESAVTLALPELRDRRLEAERKARSAREDVERAKLNPAGPRARAEAWEEAAASWRSLEKAAEEAWESEQEALRQRRRMTREAALRLLQRDMFPPHAEGSRTSKEAAEEIKEEAQNLDIAALVIFLSNPYGLTDEQLGDRLKLKPDTARARRWTLSHKLGLVEDSGRTRPNAAGRDCTVWVAWTHAEKRGKEVAA